MRVAAALLVAVISVAKANADEAADYEQGRKIGQAVASVLSTEKLVDLVTDNCGGWYKNQREMAQESSAKWHAHNDELVRKARALRKQMLVTSARAQGKQGDSEFEKNFEIMTQTALDIPANTLLAQISAQEQNKKFLSCLELIAKIEAGHLDIEKRDPVVYKFLQSVAVEK